jgi:hypothetical protein
MHTDSVDALGMRGLAQALGVSPIGMYYYVPLLSQLPTPTASPDSWNQQLRDHALAIWQLLSRYPGLSQVVLARRPPPDACGDMTQHTL